MIDSTETLFRWIDLCMICLGGQLSGACTRSKGTGGKETKPRSSVCCFCVIWWYYTNSGLSLDERLLDS